MDKERAFQASQQFLAQFSHYRTISSPADVSASAWGRICAHPFHSQAKPGHLPPGRTAGDYTDGAPRDSWSSTPSSPARRHICEDVPSSPVSGLVRESSFGRHPIDTTWQLAHVMHQMASPVVQRRNVNFKPEQNTGCQTPLIGLDAVSLPMTPPTPSCFWTRQTSKSDPSDTRSESLASDFFSSASLGLDLLSLQKGSRP